MKNYWATAYFQKLAAGADLRHMSPLERRRYLDLQSHQLAGKARQAVDSIAGPTMTTEANPNGIGSK